MQARSVGRKEEILAAVQALLIEQGYERMTFKMVAERSGAAVGSITHFFETKEALVAAVAKGVIDKLVAEAEAALNGFGLDVAPAVRSLMATCSTWSRKFPHYDRLVRYIEMDPHARASHGLQAQLEGVLAAWSRPLIAANRLAALSSGELYAILIAPAVCDVTRAVDPVRAKRRGNWLDLLSSAAVQVIMPQRQQPRKAEVRGRTKAQSPTGTPDLFERSLK